MQEVAERTDILTIDEVARILRCSKCHKDHPLAAPEPISWPESRFTTL